MRGMNIVVDTNRPKYLGYAGVMPAGEGFVVQYLVDNEGAVWQDLIINGEPVILDANNTVVELTFPLVYAVYYSAGEPPSDVYPVILND